MKLQEIAKRISEHLPTPHSFSPWAYAAGAKVMIKHKSFWGATSLSKLEALEYLAVLDGGEMINVYQFKRRQK